MSRLESFIIRVFAGNPVDMFIQGCVGAVGALVSVWIAVNPFVGVYIALVVVDTILGVRVSKLEKREFSWSHLLYGPGQKIIFTALILVASQFMQRFVPGDFLTFSVAAYMSAVLFLEVVAKYDKLSGNNVLAFIREKLRGIMPNDKDVPK